jgi:hypothetical protein
MKTDALSIVTFSAAARRLRRPLRSCPLSELLLACLSIRILSIKLQRMADTRRIVIYEKMWSDRRGNGECSRNYAYPKSPCGVRTRPIDRWQKEDDLTGCWRAPIAARCWRTWRFPIIRNGSSSLNRGRLQFLSLLNAFAKEFAQIVIRGLRVQFLPH